jgi:hypothetical protein
VAAALVVLDRAAWRAAPAEVRSVSTGGSPNTR